MKKIVSIVLVILTLAALMIPVFAGAEGTTKWVNCENGKRLNVRDSVKGKLLYRLDCGTKVEIQTSVSTPKGWAYITVPGHAKGGYVMTKFLVSSKPGKYEIIHGLCKGHQQELGPQRRSTREPQQDRESHPPSDGRRYPEGYRCRQDLEQGRRLHDRKNRLRCQRLRHPLIQIIQ